MVQIRVTHRGVFAHDVHATNLVWIGIVRQDLAHDFHHRVAGLVIQRGVPKLFKPIVRRLVGDALVVGVHHGNQTRIARALHVVLATQWVQA